MNELMILSTSFVSLTSTTNFFFFVTRSFHSTFEYFFCRNRPGIRVFRISAWQAARICCLCRSRRVLICSLSESCLWVSWALETCGPSEQTTGLSVLSWLTDDGQTGRQAFLFTVICSSSAPRQGASCRWWRHRSRSRHQGTVARQRTPGCIRHQASVMMWSLGSKPVGGTFSAKVPRSSPEVRKVFVHHIAEVEDVKQQEEQSDQRDDEEGEEVNGEVEEIRNSTHMEMTRACNVGWMRTWALSALSQCSVINLKEKQSRDADTNNKEKRLQKQPNWAVVQSTVSTSHWSMYSYASVHSNMLLGLSLCIFMSTKLIHFLSCTGIPCRDSHCENGLVRCLSSQIVRQRTWVWGRERRKDRWGKWERTCAFGQWTGHDTWVTTILRRKDVAILSHACSRDERWSFCSVRVLTHCAHLYVLFEWVFCSHRTRLALSGERSAVSTKSQSESEKTTS